MSVGVFSRVLLAVQELPEGVVVVSNKLGKLSATTGCSVSSPAVLGMLVPFTVFALLKLRPPSFLSGQRACLLRLSGVLRFFCSSDPCSASNERALPSSIAV